MNGLNKEKVASLKNTFSVTKEKKIKFKLLHKRKLLRRLGAFSVVALIILGVLVSGLVSQTASLNKQGKELAEAQTTLQELKQEQAKWEEELVRLQDDDYIAEIARRDYFYTEDGEIVFIIPEENGNTQTKEQ